MALLYLKRRIGVQASLPANTCKAGWKPALHFGNNFLHVCTLLYAIVGAKNFSPACFLDNLKVIETDVKVIENKQKVIENERKMIENERKMIEKVIENQH